MPWRPAASAVRGPAGIALFAGSLAVALRVPFLHDPPYTDEGGLLVVAAHWHAGGPFLYGRFFVDRPPVLLLLFRLSTALGGLVALRILGLLLVLISVLCAGRAGGLLGGRRGSAVGSVVTAALLADPRLGTREIDAETVGVPLVLLSVVLALEAVRRTTPAARTALLLAAGASGSCALLVKQNLADGLVFAVVLALGTRATRVVSVLLGASVPLGVAVGWSATGPGARGLWYALYGFRIAGANSLFGTSEATRLVRLHDLLLAALLSGLAALVAFSVATLLRRRPDRVTVALLAMLVTEIAGAAGGGYYWTHYLIALVPATVLLAARAVADLRRPWPLALLAALALGSSTVAVVAAAAHPAGTTEVAALSSWLDRVQRPGDSAVVLYGEASVFDATRLRPAYPFLWTLPQRVLDPHLTRLVRTLDGPRGPTYVVVRMPLDPWGQDPHHRVRRALARHYRPAARVGTDRIYVTRRDARLQRRTAAHPPPPRERATGARAPARAPSPLAP